MLEFHSNSRFNAKRGGNVDAMGVLTSQLHNGFSAPTLRIPVHVGLYVKNPFFFATIFKPVFMVFSFCLLMG